MWAVSVAFLFRMGEGEKRRWFFAENSGRFVGESGVGTRGADGVVFLSKFNKTLRETCTSIVNHASYIAEKSIVS